MKSTILVGIFAISLASATDVGFVIALDTGLRLATGQVTVASGTCRMFCCQLRCLNTNFCDYNADGIGPELDKQVSSIAPNPGVICSLFE